MSSGVKKILIIRFSSIGDIVLTTPVIRCVKTQLGAEVHFLTKKRFEPVLKANPYIDKLWLYEGNFRELIPGLRAAHFDFIADLHHNARSAYVRFRLGRPSGSFPKLNLQKWLIVNFKWNFLPDMHIVDRYFKAAIRLGLKNDGLGLDYFIPVEDEVVKPFHDYIAVVIGGKHTTKIFPADKVAEVVNRINKPVVLLGGPEDRERGDQIVKQSTGTVKNSCGEYRLNQSASVVKQASAVLTNDTGLMHIAAAFRKKMVTVWGNTVPAFGMYPYMPGHEGDSYLAEIKGLSCRPCSKLGFGECPKQHFRCMMDISADDIREHLE